MGDLSHDITDTMKVKKIDSPVLPPDAEPLLALKEKDLEKLEDDDVSDLDADEDDEVYIIFKDALQRGTLNHLCPMNRK